jgi:hypothetical protein
MTALTAARERKAGARRIGKAADWIGLAMSPTFAVMAWIAATDVPRIALCSSSSNRLPIDSMACMYLLMSLFHVSPWLRLASDRPRRFTHSHSRTEGD